MPYLGNTPSTSFATVVKDTFNGGSTAYTLSKVATTNSVSVFVENVRQEPTTAYAVSGTTLTFTATTPSGTGNIYVLHMNPTTTTTHPAAQNLTAVDGTFTGNIDVDGTANLDVVDIDGAVDMATTLAVAGNVDFNGDLDVDGTTNLDAVDIDGNVDITGTTALKDDVVFHGGNYNVTWDKTDSALEFGDNAKLTFGAGNDLQIYHTPGTGTFIDEADDGSLFIRSSRVTVHKYTGETMINAVADGAVTLSYDDSQKISTTTNGVVVGGVTAETHHSSMKTVQVGARGFLTPYDSGSVYLNSNIFYNASGQWEYATDGRGNVLSLNNGALYYYRVASGSDGDVNPTLEQSFLSNLDGAFYVYANHNGAVACTVQNAASTPYGIESKFNSVSPDNNTSWAYNFTDSTVARFRVYSDGDVVNHDNSYGSTSDERIKQDIVDANSQWDDIKNIKIRNFKKKDDVAQYGDKAWTQIGVIAQEIEKVSPKLIKEHLPDSNDIKHSAEFGTLYTKDDAETQDAVLYTKDDEEVKNGSQKVGDIKTPSTKQIGDVKEIKANVKKVSYSVLYMKAVKALQEAMTRIETLESEVAKLKE